MRNPAHVPELQHDAPAGNMNCLGNAFPILDLLFAVYSRCGDVALAFGCDLCCFGNDESRAGALRIIKRMELGGYIAGAARLRVRGAITIRLGSVNGPTWNGSKRSVIVLLSGTSIRELRKKRRRSPPAANSFTRERLIRVPCSRLARVAA